MIRLLGSGLFSALLIIRFLHYSVTSLYCNKTAHLPSNISQFSASDNADACKGHYCTQQQDQSLKFYRIFATVYCGCEHRLQGFSPYTVLYDIQCAQLQEIIRYNTVVVRTVTAYVYLTILKYIVASSWRGEFQR